KRRFDRRNEKSRSGFSGSLTNSAMVQALFKDDAFMIKQRSIKVKIKIHTKHLRADISALLDSGATNNFINPTIVNRFKLPTVKLDKPKYIRNVDGSRNSIGTVTKATDLEIQYGILKETQRFYIINMGGDDAILGYPFLAATNPPVNWKEGIFYGHVIAATQNAHLWTPRSQLHNRQRNAIMEQNDTTGHDSKFIPNNERGYITMNPRSAHSARRITMATQLALQAAN